MKTPFRSMITCLAGIAILSVSCNDSSIKPLDYSQADNWMIQSPVEHEVDLFYIYPTSANPDCKTFVSPVDSVMKAKAYYSYLQNAECFSGYTNVFAPYYRQLSTVGLMSDLSAEGIIRNDRENEPWCDIKAALDYYFTELNTDRPVLFASHSQGSAVMHIVMDTYMKEHPELKSRIVAVYAIGYQITPEWCEEAGIPFATGEEDTGVILTWNTEGAGATGDNAVGCNSLAINPLNWKTDTTYAGIELNKGSLATNKEGEIVKVPGRADAQFCPDRGAIICSTDTNYLPKNPMFGEKSFHFEDGALFYQNMKENGRKRIAAYLGHEPDTNPKSETAGYTPARVIDVEHHMFNKEFINYLKTRTDFPYYDNSGIWYHNGSLLPIGVKVQTPYKVSEASTGKLMVTILENMDDIRLADMEVAGVTTAVVSTGEGPEFLPEKESVKYSRMANDAMSEAMKKHPGKFVGSITLPTPYVEESVKELERAVKKLGLKYWHTHSNYGHSYLYEKKYEPLLAKCAELDIPIYIHPSYPTADYLTDYGTMLSSAGFGFGVDVMKTTICIILNGTFDKYPDLKIILGHAGEFLPFCLDRMDNRFAVAAGSGEPDPYVNNKRTFTDLVNDGNILVTTSGIFDPLVVDFIIKKIGIDHIMLGTDYPYEDFKASVDFIKNLPICNEDKDKILYKNAEKYILTRK